MDIILGKTAGFCFGVANAVNKTKIELDNCKENNLYCLGELVHNSQVMEQLENKGLEVIQNIDEAKKGQTVIIRAHGEAPGIYIKAKANNVKLIDLTCPKVIKVHDIIEKYAKKEYFILITGDSNHPETIGNKGYAGKKSFVIKDIEDITNDLIKILQKEKNILLVSQTTFSLSKFNKIVEILNKNDIDITIEKTICNATEIRQKETLELSKKVDLMIVIGGKKSSNTAKLYEIANQHTQSICIETKDEIDIEVIKGFNTIGVMAGASTPNFIINEIIELLQKTNTILI